MNNDVKNITKGLFSFTSGAVSLVDGQYGSTGKGVIAAALSEVYSGEVEYNITNAGPNSGHTFYTMDGRKIVLKQLPTFAVASHLNNMATPIIALTAGAIIDHMCLHEEVDYIGEYGHIDVHPHSVIIDKLDVSVDQINVSGMASTGKGIGPAMIRKLERKSTNIGTGGKTPGSMWHVPHNKRIFMEVSQGFSLGINSGFYPHVTTRECTVSQGFSDAGLPPSMFRGSILSLRTFPIRVGSTENSSGPCYDDQHEISFEDIGQQPEFTTVTKRLRRIFTWSRQQFKDAVKANDPGVLFVNFMNYLPKEEHDKFLDNLIRDFVSVSDRNPKILLGFGPTSDDIVGA